MESENKTKRIKLDTPNTTEEATSSDANVPSKNEEPSEVEIHETDLPLLANVEDIKVLHYLLKLQFDFNTKQVQGVLVLFLTPTNPEIPWNKIILDSCSIKVHKVYLLKRIQEFKSSNLVELNKNGRKNFYNSQNIDWFAVEGSELNFQVEKWFVNINGWCSEKINECPSVIRIHYSVLPSTPSLNWRPINGWNYDEGLKCVFTPASPVNNRGLFPCQEPPSAMATWECFIQIDKIYLPLLASDEIGTVILEDEERKTHYFYSSMNLPMSTFAIVIGQFPLQVPIRHIVLTQDVGLISREEVSTKCNHEIYPCRLNDPNFQTKDAVQLRMFSLSNDININLDDLSNFLETAIKSTYKILGTYPFARLDLIILPKCFADLGLCNPNMIFVSPSLFSGDDPLYYFRLPHEISHFWFGLLIGALDWLEEFLSEGFATFMEDVLYKEMNRGIKDELEIMEEIDTKACLRLITLQNELKNTDSDLHVLSLQNDNISNKAASSSVKHGLQAIKKFMQVHYLKGYFLLKYLSHLVGYDKFLLFLRLYVNKFHGQLVTSGMFFEYYFETFSKVLDLDGANNLCIETVKSIWMRSNDLPEPFKFCDILNNKLHPKFLEIFPHSQKSLISIQNVFDNLCSSEETSVNLIETLSSTQLVLLLEKCISCCGNEQVSKRTYNSLINSPVKEITHNPEIIHRYCIL